MWENPRINHQSSAPSPIPQGKPPPIAVNPPPQFLKQNWGRNRTDTKAVRRLNILQAKPVKSTQKYNKDTKIV